jgi:hypothetical protein
VQFTQNVPAAVRREVMQPLGGGDPAVHAEARRQWLNRNGYEQVDTMTGMTASEVKALPVAQRVELTKARIGGMASKDANEVARMTATGQAAESKVGLKVKENTLAAQEKTSKLLDEYSKAPPERQAAIEKELVMLGAKQPRAEKEKKVHFQKTYDEFGKVTGEEPFLLDEDTAEGRPIRLGGGGGVKDTPLPTRIPDRKEGEVYTTANGKFKWDGKGLIRVQ